MIEGLDGAGKSTQAGAVISHFSAHPSGAFRATYEPTHFLVGGLVRGRLLNEWICSSECLQLLFAADRADHLEKEIQPWLKKGVSIICDRYFLSSVAYGSIDCDTDWLLKINSKFLAPDLTIYLDAMPSVCIKRMLENGRSIELFEKKGVLERVAANYKKALTRLEGEIAFTVVNGDRPPEAITKDIIGLLNSNFFNYKPIANQ